MTTSTPTLNVTSHRDLAAAGADLATKVTPIPAAGIDRDALLAALGARAGDLVGIAVLLDRSGSVGADGAREQMGLVEHLDELEDAPGLLISASGYSGVPARPDLYQVKAPGRPSGAALNMLPQVGHGATPTAEAVRHATRSLLNAPVDIRALIVVTDDMAPEGSGDVFDGARRHGVDVFTVVCGTLASAVDVDLARRLDSAFGASLWIAEPRWNRALTAALELMSGVPAARSAASAPTMTADVNSSERDGVDDAMITLAGETLVALGADSVQAAFSALGSSANDTMRRVCHYAHIRVRFPHYTQAQALSAANHKAATYRP